MDNLEMYTNEGNIALAEKLNEALESMPAGLTIDAQYARVSDLCKADPDFNARHSEWQDTAVREAIYSWLDAPEPMTTIEAAGTIELGALIRIAVPTLNGDADEVLNERLDEISDIFQEAIETAMSELDRRVGDASSYEWSGVQVRII